MRPASLHRLLGCGNGETRRSREDTVKNAVKCLVLALIPVFMLVGCDPVDTSDDTPMESVSLPEAQEATDAIMNSNESAFDDCVIDDGTTPTLYKGRNAGGTLFLEASLPAGDYPKKRTYSFVGYREPVSGYELTGSVYVTWNDTEDDTCAVNVSFSHESKPVERVRGNLTLPDLSSTPAGKLEFNDDTYSVGDLTQHFFSH
jgi:hypothetical protein